MVFGQREDTRPSPTVGVLCFVVTRPINCRLSNSSLCRCRRLTSARTCAGARLGAEALGPINCCYGYRLKAGIRTLMMVNCGFANCSKFEPHLHQKQPSFQTAVFGVFIEIYRVKRLEP